MSAPESSLPPKLGDVAALFDTLPESVRDLFLYALAMLVVEDGKAAVVGHQTGADGRERLEFRTPAGDLFEIVRPKLSEELLVTLTEMAHKILAEDERRE